MRSLSRKSNARVPRKISKWLIHLFRTTKNRMTLSATSDRLLSSTNLKQIMLILHLMSIRTLVRRTRETKVRNVELRLLSSTMKTLTTTTQVLILMCPFAKYQLVRKPTSKNSTRGPTSLPLPAGPRESGPQVSGLTSQRVFTMSSPAPPKEITNEPATVDWYSLIIFQAVLFN
jgi:hypothetical protein